MGYAIFWFLCALFSAFLAESKKRNAFGWFVLGLLFGPFGLLVAFFPKLDAAPSPGAPASDSDTKACPFCAETIKSAAMVCRFCNRELPVVASSHDSTSGTQANGTQPHDELMARYGISHDGEKYIYNQYRYDKLEDAVRYASKSLPGNAAGDTLS